MENYSETLQKINWYKIYKPYQCYEFRRCSTYYNYTVLIPLNISKQDQTAFESMNLNKIHADNPRKLKSHSGPCTLYKLNDIQPPLHFLFNFETKQKKTNPCHYAFLTNFEKNSNLQPFDFLTWLLFHEFQISILTL